MSWVCACPNKRQRTGPPPTRSPCERALGRLRVAHIIELYELKLPSKLPSRTDRRASADDVLPTWLQQLDVPADAIVQGSRADSRSLDNLQKWLERKIHCHNDKIREHCQ
eukprot:727038-Pleurochrysis_carterae.AAC.1